MYKKIIRKIIRIGTVIGHNFKSLKNKHKRKSYSQSGEDIIVNYIFEQIGILKPTYMDIGAHHPYYLNNTQLFYDKGCTGINVEPDPSLFKLFPKYRKKDLNINCGIGSSQGELWFNIMSASTLNTFSLEEAQRFQTDFGFKIEKKVMIKVKTIKSILSEYHIQKFPDFLSVDIEGLEEEVIRSFDFNVDKPTVICLETISYSETGKGKKNHDLINYLKDKGYMEYADTNINTIFVLKEKWLRD